MDRRTGGVQFAAERIVIAVRKMIRLSVGIGSGPYVLEFALRNRRLVSRQHVCAGGRFAGREENDRDKRRDNSERKAT